MKYFTEIYPYAPVGHICPRIILIAEMKIAGKPLFLPHPSCGFYRNYLVNVQFKLCYSIKGDFPFILI